MNDPGLYSTISKPSQGIYKEKGSKFISYAFPVSSLGQVNEILAQLRKEHHAARHHCFAYRIRGPVSDLVRANDDGEPTFTAGKPILRQIESAGLVNIIIVVIRYFGGTLLGKGGLIQAYKNASSDAINNAEIIRVEPVNEFIITTDYTKINDILKIAGSEGAEIVSSNYQENITIKINIPKSNTERVKSRLKQIAGVSIKKTK